MSIYRGVGGVNRPIKQIYRGVGGVNRQIKEIYRGVSGVNRKVFYDELYIVENGVTGGEVAVTYNRDIADFYWRSPVSWVYDSANACLKYSASIVEAWSTIQSTNMVDLTPFDKLEIEVRTNMVMVGNTFLVLSDVAEKALNKTGTTTYSIPSNPNVKQKQVFDISSIDGMKYVGFFTAKEANMPSGNFITEVFNIKLY